MQNEIKPNIPYLQLPTQGGLYRRCIKRLMDFILSLITIIVLSPVLLVVALLVRVKIGSPVIFKQKRLGFKEEIFTLYKFRTMTDERDENGKLLSDSLRLTKFGRILRSTSLDELPELINIIKGDMSVIGPRPLHVRYQHRYNEKQKRRHDVRPGLSGLAQINGRNAITWEQKFDWDVEYVENITFWGDWKIIFLTIYKTLKRDGITDGGESTMGEFWGTKIKEIRK